MKIVHWIKKTISVLVDLACRLFLIQAVLSMIYATCRLSQTPFASLQNISIFDESACLTKFYVDQFASYYLAGLEIVLLARGVWRLKPFTRTFLVWFWNWLFIETAIGPFLDMQCPTYFFWPDGYYSPSARALVTGVLTGIWCLIALYQLHKYPVFSKTRTIIHWVIFILWLTIAP